MYLFSSNKNHIDQYRRELSFGGGCINDVVIHLATSKMAFGGVGESGMGAYHGKRGFEALFPTSNPSSIKNLDRFTHALSALYEQAIQQAAACFLAIANRELLSSIPKRDTPKTFFLFGWLFRCSLSGQVFLQALFLSVFSKRFCWVNFPCRQLFSGQLPKAALKYLHLVRRVQPFRPFRMQGHGPHGLPYLK